MARFRGHALRVNVFVDQRFSSFHSGVLTFLNGTDGILGVELVKGDAFMVRASKHVLSFTYSYPREVLF